MEYRIQKLILTDGSPVYDLIVKDSQAVERTLVFHCVDKEACEDLANSIEQNTTGFMNY